MAVVLDVIEILLRYQCCRGGQGQGVEPWHLRSARRSFLLVLVGLFCLSSFYLDTASFRMVHLLGGARPSVRACVHACVRVCVCVCVCVHT